MDGIGIGAAEEDADAGVGGWRPGASEEGGEGCSTAGFGDDAEVGPEPLLCFADGGVGDEDGVHAGGERDAEGERACDAGTQAVGGVATDGDWDRVAGGQGGVEGWAGVGLDCDDFGAGAGIPGGDSADEAAAAYGNEDVGEVWGVGLEFAADGPLTGEDGVLVVGVNAHRAGSFLIGVARGEGVEVGLALDGDGGAVGADAVELGGGGGCWDEDRGGVA